MENSSIHLTLASSSPRRRQLLEEAGFRVRVIANRADESYPATMDPARVAEYLARKKADQLSGMGDELVLTADTIVKVDNDILGKPANYDEGVKLLQRLSGRSHEVITGVCIRKGDKMISFDDLTRVYFKALSTAEIDYYLSGFSPYDKAGGYGIQEWLGMVAVERIEGSYFTVVGLPVHKVYQALREHFFN